MNWRTRPKRNWTNSVTLAKCAECEPKRTKRWSSMGMFLEGVILEETKKNNGSGYLA